MEQQVNHKDVFQITSNGTNVVKPCVWWPGSPPVVGPEVKPLVDDHGGSAPAGPASGAVPPGGLQVAGTGSFSHLAMNV